MSEIAYKLNRTVTQPPPVKARNRDTEARNKGVRKFLQAHLAKMQPGNSITITGMSQQEISSMLNGISNTQGITHKFVTRTIDTGSVGIWRMK
jgi:hypothetical protein